MQSQSSMFALCSPAQSYDLPWRRHLISFHGEGVGRVGWGDDGWHLMEIGRTERERERDSRIIASNIKRTSVFPLFFLVPLVCSSFPCQNCAFYSWLEWSHSNNLGGPPTTHPWVSYHPNRISAAHSCTRIWATKSWRPVFSQQVWWRRNRNLIQNQRNWNSMSLYTPPKFNIAPEKFPSQ